MTRFFGLDTRSLALCRILLGLILIWDLGTRLLWVKTFSWGQGLNPESLGTEHLPLPFIPSVHLLSSNLWYQGILLVLHLVLASLFLVGWRTRWITPLLWFFTLSLHLSNEWVLNGGDYLLRNLLFFGCFLPWGEQFSWSGEPEEPRQFADAASLALFTQLALLYWSTAMLKFSPIWTTEGTALFYALHMDSFTTQAGLMLLPYPQLLKVLTHFVYLLEWTAPILVLSGYPKIRMLGLTLLVSLHLGIAVCLSVGLFWLVPIALACGLLPTEFWNTKAQQSEGIQNKGVSIFLALALISLTYLNLGRMPHLKLPTPLPLYRVMRGLGLHYGWEMFTGLSRQSNGWFLVEAETVDGVRKELLWNLDSREKPELVSSLFPNQRWRRYTLNLKKEAYAKHCPVLVHYLLSRDGGKFKSARLVYMKEKTSLTYRDSAPEVEVLYSEDDLLSK